MSLPSSLSVSDFKASADCPAAQGFRMPAEWEPQRGIWLSWPIRQLTWPGHYATIPAKFAEIVAKIGRFEDVYINVPQEHYEEALVLFKQTGADLSRIKLFRHPINDTWCRDHGPIFVKNDRTGEVAVVDWVFNAWGGKYSPSADDNEVPKRVAEALGFRRFSTGMVLEGGSIDVNGQGLLLTTEACLLNPNRNPKLSRGLIEQHLRDYLGVREIFWLGDGVDGDDTDGHVDDLTRFFKPLGVVTAVERDERDVNYRPLRENLERLKSLRTAKGGKFEIFELPMPEACVTDGQRLPASYANFLILNGAVLVPVFRQPSRDAQALEILGSCFPGREIVPVDCREWVIGRGTLHCISQQQPS
jgi:agmatine deiminase